MADAVVNPAEFVFEAIRYEVSGNILNIVLNRPHVKNAINQIMTNELICLLRFAKDTRDIRVVVLSAEGDTFCAGGDLKGMRGQGDQDTISTVPALGESDDLTLLFYHLNKPLIVKVQGPVYAGALLMVCNATHVVAADHAHFSAPEVRRGLWPMQVMAGLFRILPRRAAMDFVMRGTRISAVEAERLGLINTSVPSAQLDTEVDALAKELASFAPDVMKIGLNAMRRQEEMSFDEALPFLKRAFLDCIASPDGQEGLAAFAEKRPPDWS